MKFVDMIRKCKSNKDSNIRDTVRFNISSINNAMGECLG